MERDGEWYARAHKQLKQAHEKRGARLRRSLRRLRGSGFLGKSYGHQYKKSCVTLLYEEYLEQNLEEFYRRSIYVDYYR